ncbi:hypothetical protein FNYG_05358 [Fusarium nygamai]|uniref:Uncharacterized protein n=1 Tax=Gibberella nygamai TaxID=42673 RepID=A0A2K0WGD5_GIBNY|nr:hypothetical protein FNYG_05358 [Fusarium nygamai]
MVAEVLSEAITNTIKSTKFEHRVEAWSCAEVLSSGGCEGAEAREIEQKKSDARCNGLRQFPVYQGRWPVASPDFERDIMPMCQENDRGGREGKNYLAAASHMQ